jgi:hypothetical protein
MGFKNEQDRLDYESKKQEQAREVRNDIGTLLPINFPLLMFYWREDSTGEKCFGY